MTFATFLCLSCKKVVFLQSISREFWLILKLIEKSRGRNAMAFFNPNRSLGRLLYYFSFF